MVVESQALGQPIEGGTVCWLLEFPEREVMSISAGASTKHLVFLPPSERGAIGNNTQALLNGGAVRQQRSDLDCRYLNKPESHGKLFTSLVREHLGMETLQKSPLAAERDALSAEVARLKALLRRHGIDPA